MSEPTVEESQELSPEVAELQAALQKVTDERDQVKDQMLRAMADFQNFRKRTQGDMEAARAYATEKFVTDLLPVLDNFERSVAAIESGASVDGVIEGIRALERQLRSALESQKVSKIEAHGAEFDPELHEALAIEESSEHPDNTVIAELQTGYRMGDKVIRPARVRVAKKA